MKNRTGPTINARFCAISGSIATTCLSEIRRPHARWKERLLKRFVVWCRNWSLKKWQNVRRFGTGMSKTHGCVNPCYHVFTPPHPHPHPLPSPTQPCTHAAWSAAMGTGWRPDWMETWQGLRGGGTIYKQYRVFAGWNMNKTCIVKVGFPIAAMAFSCGAQLFLWMNQSILLF